MGKLLALSHNVKTEGMNECSKQLYVPDPHENKHGFIVIETQRIHHVDLSEKQGNFFDLFIGSVFNLLDRNITAS